MFSATTEEVDRVFIYEEKFKLLERSEEDIANRKEILAQHYDDISLYDEYTERNGREYVKEYYKSAVKFTRTKATKLIERNIIDDNTLRVKLETDNTYIGGEAAIREVDFTEVNGELRLSSKIFPESIYAEFENSDAKKSVEQINKEHDELWDYTYKILNDGVLEEDEVFYYFNDRQYDANTDTKYWGISTLDRGAVGTKYFINIKNGDIYSRVDNRFVVKDGKII